MRTPALLLYSSLYTNSTYCTPTIMITVKKEGVVLHKTNYTFEEEGVLNPGVIKEGNLVHLFYRAVSKGNYSTIGYGQLDGPLKLTERMQKPLLEPFFDFELHGIEDPRIVKIDNLYYLTYTAYNGENALGALAFSTDLITFDRYGLITPQITYDQFKQLTEHDTRINPKYYRHVHHFQPSDKIYLWDKDVVFFPRRINNKLYFLHRLKPGIQLVAVDNLNELTPNYWNAYFANFQSHILLDPIGDSHEACYVGAGCPPIETEKGWLLIYHGVRDTEKGYVYAACVALLDLDNPMQVLARLPYPLFVPEFDWELHGTVDNVVFPTGTALFGDTLYIYYGAADDRIACASVSIAALLSELAQL